MRVGDMLQEKIRVVTGASSRANLPPRRMAALSRRLIDDSNEEFIFDV
jgi:hypothetical protein